MSLPLMSQPSPAALLDEARRKARDEFFLFLNEVKVQMKELKKQKEKLSKKYPDRDFVTISDIDLTNALHTGVIKRVDRCHDSSWILDINGPATDGSLLAIAIYLPDEGPLAFMSFALLPENKD